MVLIILVILGQILIGSSKVLYTVTNDTLTLYWDVSQDEIFCYYLTTNISDLQTEILYNEKPPYTILNLIPNASYKLTVVFNNESEIKYNFRTKSNFFGTKSVYCSRNLSELYVEWHETDFCAKSYLVSIKAINPDNTSTGLIEQKEVSSTQKSTTFYNLEDYPEYWASVQTFCYSEYSPEVTESCTNIYSEIMENPVLFNSESFITKENDSEMSNHNFYYYLLIGLVVILVVISSITVFRIFKLRKILATSFSILSYGKTRYVRKIQGVSEVPTDDTFNPRLRNCLDEKLKYNIEDLELLHIIGHGQFGNVHFGRLTLIKSKIKVDVAVKVSKYLISQEHIEKINKEALIMQNFNHDNVLTLIGICINENGIPLVILPYLRDGDLNGFLKNKDNVISGKLNQKQLTLFAIDVAKGMEYLSEQRVVHRDLAARNCMIDLDHVLKIYHVKVSDFGLSRDISDKDYYRIADHNQGLPTRWLAIECFEDQIFTTKSDVWSFGILVWEIFSLGTVPYKQFNSNEVYKKLKEGFRLEKPVNCSESVFQLMTDCWLTDPKERPDFTLLINRLNDSLTQLETSSIDNQI